MSNVTRSIVVFGAYLALSGLMLVLIPDALLPLLGLPAPADGWVRVVGLLTLILAMYFLYSARHNDLHFQRATLIARVMFFTGITAFVLLDWAPPLLLAFGLVDLAGAAWTWLALRAEGHLRETA